MRNYVVNSHIGCNFLVGMVSTDGLPRECFLPEILRFQSHTVRQLIPKTVGNSGQRSASIHITLEATSVDTPTSEVKLSVVKSVVNGLSPQYQSLASHLQRL